MRLGGGRRVRGRRGDRRAGKDEEKSEKGLGDCIRSWPE